MDTMLLILSYLLDEIYDIVFLPCLVAGVWGVAHGAVLLGCGCILTGILLGNILDYVCNAEGDS